MTHTYTKVEGQCDQCLSSKRTLCSGRDHMTPDNKGDCSSLTFTSSSRDLAPSGTERKREKSSTQYESTENLIFQT